MNIVRRIIVMKYLIKEQECGYLLKNGILQGLLFAGKHTIHSFLGYELRIVSMMGKVDTKKLPTELLMRQPEFASGWCGCVFPIIALAYT